MVFAPESRMIVCCLSKVDSLGLVPYWHELQFGGGGKTLAIDYLILHTAQSGGPSSIENGIYNLVRVAAAAAKSLQSCLTLCDPIDGSPPGFSVHGIFQARVLEWVAIAFSVVHVGHM